MKYHLIGVIIDRERDIVVFGKVNTKVGNYFLSTSSMKLIYKQQKVFLVQAVFFTLFLLFICSSFLYDPTNKRMMILKESPESISLVPFCWKKVSFFPTGLKGEMTSITSFSVEF